MDHCSNFSSSNLRALSLSILSGRIDTLEDALGQGFDSTNTVADFIAKIITGSTSGLVGLGDGYSFPNTNTSSNFHIDDWLNDRLADSTDGSDGTSFRYGGTSEVSFDEGDCPGVNSSSKGAFIRACLQP